MVFAYDTEVALASAAALVNTAFLDPDPLADDPGLTLFLEQERFSGSRTHTAAERQAVQRLRTDLLQLWDSSEETLAQGINRLLASSQALPQLVRHDGWGWHLHCTPPDADLADRMATEAAMALADVVRAGELERLRICAAPDCSGVLIDLSRNRSRRYCGTGNCGNRENVRAYRRRLASNLLENQQPYGLP
ncbi:CGNR zinc finger domain-containing protein [Arthrobacter sp. zg-Y916]|uniref:CGNR zinc finger domain-containing protein n=1 Tax=Arthrobacter caoxuetaonis TaxID=2886935 RepID=A0A9X1MEB8_9MICC|nr:MULTISPECIES: CGNR zinc finger domain-containing protein [Arthrobacter]MCC3298503.1 CGNR zinc finger domain-containing protein [Arthrobacter caoxuetaonis]MCC9194728.1 CGNR zinc finger domain-containing protein [Arthrobacter sp. zg-Y916]USQ57250.1 CGNR zinc finger domain-containing protein [Arthrobacter caoxuetaonis]